MASNEASVNIYEKKLKQYEEPLEDLADDFAANDDGDIELRDIEPFIIDALKVMKVEIEGSYQLANFVVSTFVKEFVDFLKQAKKLKRPDSLLASHDVLKMFSAYLKRNASKITVVDLISSGMKPQVKQPPPQPAGKPQPAKAQPPQKKSAPVQEVPEQPEEYEYGSEYEEVEEEFEEEMEEEGEVDFNDADGNLLESSGQGGKQKSEAVKKPKEEQKYDPGEHKLKKDIVLHKKPKDHVSHEKKKGSPDQKKKQLLFKDDQAPDEGQDESPVPQGKRKMPQIVLDKLTINEADNNVFQGIAGQSPDKNEPIMDVLSPVPRKPNQNNKKKEHQRASGNDKIEQLKQLVSNVQNQKTIRGQDVQQTSLLNIDKFLLESQDTYRSPGLLDEVPDYIRQISSTVGIKDLNDPQIQEVIQHLQRQITARNDPHYDERMNLDHQLSDPDLTKFMDIQQLAQALQIPKGKSSTNLDKTQSGVKSSSSGAQQFQLTPLRNPTSDSLKIEEEEKKGLQPKANEGIDKFEAAIEDEQLQKKRLQPAVQINIDVWKKEEVIPQVNQIQLPQQQQQIPFNETPKINPPTQAKKVEKPPVQVPKIKRVYDQIVIPVKVLHEMGFTKVLKGGNFGRLEMLIRTANEDKEWFSTLPISVIKAAKGVIEYEKNLDEMIVMPELPEPVVDSIQIQPPIASVPMAKRKPFYSSIPPFSQQASKNDQWFDTIQVKRPKPFFDFIKLQKQDQLEFRIPEESPPSKEQNIASNVKVSYPSQEVQQQPDKQNLITQQKQGWSQEKPSNSIQIQQQQIPQLREEQQKIRKLDTDKNPILEDEKKKEEKQRLDLEKIRIEATKQWKREQAELPKQEMTTQQELPTPKPIVVPPANLKVLQAKKKSEKTVQISEVPEVKFSDQLRQPTVVKQRPIKKEAIKPILLVKLAEPVIQQLEAAPKEIEKKCEESKRESQQPLQRKPSLKLKQQIEAKPALQKVLPLALPVQQLEDKGHQSDNSIERKNQQPTARQKLVKTIQLYEKLLGITGDGEETPQSKENLNKAVTDLRKQLKLMDQTSIHQDEMTFQGKLQQFMASPTAFASLDSKRSSLIPLLKGISPQKSRSPSPGDASPIIKGENPDIKQNQENMTSDYDENTKKTLDKLKEVFQHYISLHLSSKKASFEDIKEEQGLLNFPKCIAFIQDFQLTTVSPMKVSEVFKKSALHSRVMQFGHFKTFLERLYSKHSTDADRDKLKRKILQVNFKIKKAETNQAMDIDVTQELQALQKEKTSLKKQLKELGSKSTDINQVYKQISDDLKLEDSQAFQAKMRGYIPEYDKLPKIQPSKQGGGGKGSPKQGSQTQKMDEELASAVEGVIKVPEFLKLQELMQRAREQESKLREQLRDQSRTQRKAIAQSMLSQQSQQPITLEHLKQRQGSKLQHKAILDLIEIEPTPGRARSKSRLKRQSFQSSPFQEKQVKFPELATGRLRQGGTNLNSPSSSFKQKQLLPIMQIN